jgi:hypothetical protein
MSIEFKGNTARFREVASVEEAEGLLEWLQKRPSTRKVDLASCTHLHAANLQVLMAAQARITAWPADPLFAAWLRSALGDGASLPSVVSDLHGAINQGEQAWPSTF